MLFKLIITSTIQAVSKSLLLHLCPFKLFLTQALAIYLGFLYIVDILYTNQIFNTVIIWAIHR